MIMLDEVINTLDNNQFLDLKIKDSIKELIISFNSKFPDISLNNLNKLLGTLKIEKSNKFINRRVYKYNMNTNILEFNVNEIEKGFDMKNIMMIGLLKLIAFNGKQVGFNANNKYEGLQEGYLKILANNIVGNDSDIEDLEEIYIETNMIGILIGDEILFKAYFNNDTDLLEKALIDRGMDI